MKHLAQLADSMATERSVTPPKKRFSGIVVSWSLLLCSTGFARNIYVATTGSDSSAGTMVSPFATIAKAAASSAPGDSIVIRGGTYKLSPQIDPKSGTSESARITYKSYPGEAVLVDGGAGYCFSLAHKSHITFDGLKFTTSDTAVGAGMFYFENTNHIAFHDCEFFGMPAERGAENTSVIRCMASGWPDTARIENSDSCVFRNNYFHGNASPVFRLYDTKGWVIENNKFVNCLQAVGGKEEPYDLLVRRNLIIGGDLAFYFPLQGGGNGVTITENVIVGTDNGFTIGGLGTYGHKRLNVNVYNNTFYNARIWLNGWNEPQFDSAIKFWNNIVYSDFAANIPPGAEVSARFISMYLLPMNPSLYSIDYDDYSMPTDDRSRWFFDGGESFNGLSTWTAGRPSFDAHSVSANPLFSSVADSNFHLQAGSPCKGKGKAGEDLGAYPRGNDGTVIGLLTNIPTDVRGYGHGRQSASDRRRILGTASYGVNGRQIGTAIHRSAVYQADGESKVAPRH